MGRWEPNARGRLERAALALYRERGYERVTVAEIAREAGLTERTFFRHYADKREVLFGGSAALQEFLVGKVAAAPADTSPIELVVAALAATGEVFDERRDRARQRQTVIDAHPELRERELIKLATLATALAGALRERGVEESAAILAAQAGIAVFQVAFVRWLADGERDMAELVRGAYEELRTVTAGG
ncbi:TetR/AcrR family transcriptional regulator [Actinocatenispora rupis]|uniref:TetR family transcriptional regulator n=1 Tax=Actinocatenispora rupis TaxID=519421 RepID=A0A8J3J8C9_9ACTN|nr:TetR/AcrR family transcriptional regulator [Actinocatenispora rupis]GID13825.1 TetR family transcriptional regulator [Actinocatenispora rupis]